MSKTKIQIGDAVIINECDRPCTSCVAIVTAIDRFGAVTALYLNARLANRKKDGKSVSWVITDSSPFEATAVVDFGVVIFLLPREDKFLFRCAEQLSLPAISQYSVDGRTRHWQELGTDCDEFGWCEANEEVMQLWKGHV